MNSDEMIATYLRYISQGVKVNTYQLQHRTDLIYQKLNRENSPNSNSFEDHELFELAIIQAFKELISESIKQSEVVEVPVVRKDLQWKGWRYGRDAQGP